VFGPDHPAEAVDAFQRDDRPGPVGNARKRDRRRAGRERALRQHDGVARRREVQLGDRVEQPLVVGRSPDLEPELRVVAASRARQSGQRDDRGAA
jgi:hypothetical protein